MGEDYEAMKYNTAIAAMMSLVNEFYAAGGCTREELRTLILLLSPVAPHICEEMWEQMGFGSGLAREPWPTYDEKAMKRTEDVYKRQTQRLPAHRTLQGTGG